LHIFSISEWIQLIHNPNKNINTNGRNNHIWGINKNYDPILGQEANQIFEKFNQYFFPLENKQEIRGQVGSIGRYIGKVKVIGYDVGGFENDFKWENENKKVQEGEVLVCIQTVPQLLPACIKAGALVTDEGGVTCHAAVVARELKKPAVIGTQYASKLFHDGDVVEVDAINGIVKLLEKSTKPNHAPETIQSNI